MTKAARQRIIIAMIGGTAVGIAYRLLNASAPRRRPKPKGLMMGIPLAPYPQFQLRPIPDNTVPYLDK